MHVMNVHLVLNTIKIHSFTQFSALTLRLCAALYLLIFRFPIMYRESVSFPLAVHDRGCGAGLPRGRHSEGGPRRGIGAGGRVGKQGGGGVRVRATSWAEVGTPVAKSQWWAE